LRLDSDPIKNPEVVQPTLRFDDVSLPQGFRGPNQNFAADNSRTSVLVTAEENTADASLRAFLNRVRDFDEVDCFRVARLRRRWSCSRRFGGNTKRRLGKSFVEIQGQDVAAVGGNGQVGIGLAGSRTDDAEQRLFFERM